MVLRGIPRRGLGEKADKDIVDRVSTEVMPRDLPLVDVPMIRLLKSGRVAS